MRIVQDSTDEKLATKVGLVADEIAKEANVAAYLDEGHRGRLRPWPEIRLTSAAKAPRCGRCSATNADDPRIAAVDWPNVDERGYLVIGTKAGWGDNPADIALLTELTQEARDSRDPTPREIARAGVARG